MTVGAQVGEDGRLLEVVWPQGLESETLPTYLALPLWEYLAEPNPRVRLHWMLDAMEVALRWSVAILLAEVLADNDDSLPPMLARSLQDHIERPTVGRWVGMMRSLSAAPPRRAPLSGQIFALHDAHVAPLFSADGGEHESMLVLRNRVAHGGGLSARKSAELLAAHDPHFLKLVRAIADCTADLSICARAEGDGIVSLRGLKPSPSAAVQSLPDGPAESAWLTDGTTALSLSPLVAYGPIRTLDKNGQFVLRDGAWVPQIYARASGQSLSYTPLGRDEAHAERAEVEAFRTLFGLGEGPGGRSGGAGARRGFAHDDFVREASDAAESLVGRVAECKTIKDWLKRCPTREAGVPHIAWLRAGPGIGKSSVMARIARDLSNSSHHGLYFHHFQTGDVRNNRRMFLHLLQEALWAWEPLKAQTVPPASGADEDELLLDVSQRLDVLGRLTSKNARAPAPSFRILIDGLDAVMPQDPGFPDLIRQLNLPGTAWLIAGRPDHGLGSAFAAPDVLTLFPESGGALPAMRSEDIRSLLLEGLGNARYALLKRDEEAGGDDEGVAVRNTFVDRVVERAGGLPLYVELLLGDLRSGFLTVDDEDRLPDGLSTYYADLIGRMAISDVQVNLTLLICLLARAEEPLDRRSVQYLLSPSLDIGEEVLEPEDAAHVGAVLRAGRTLLRETVAPSGERAYVLYHNGFREYINGTEALKRTRRRAEALLYQTADRWRELPESNLRNHLFRWGTEYALWWGSLRGLRAAGGRLRDFGYLMARTGALPAFENLDLAQEYALISARLPEDEDFAAWAAFVRSHDHLLRRGSPLWTADRILLQLAMEYADSSPVTRAAEAWLDACPTPWLWLRRERRPAHVSLSASLSVLEGHSRKIHGAILLSGEQRVLSWSLDNTLRFWDLGAGVCLRALEGHSKRIQGAVLLPDSRALSYSEDGTARLWSLESGEVLHTLDEHEGKSIEHLVLLPDGRALTCARDRAKTVKLWELASGTCQATFKGHRRYVKRLCTLSDGRFLSIDRTMRLWDPAAPGKPLQVLSGHSDEILGVALLDDERRLLSWSKDQTLRLWDLASGAEQAVLTGHSDEVLGAQWLEEDGGGGGQILSWSKDQTLRVWSAADGAAVAALVGHVEGAVTGALVLDAGRLLSWTDAGEILIWSRASGAVLARLEGHDGAVQGMLRLGAGRLLSLSSRGAIEAWDDETGTHIARLSGHTTGVEGAVELSGGRMLTWAGDRTLRVWSTDPALLARVDAIDRANIDPEAHPGYVAGTRMLADGETLSWSKDTTLRLWGEGPVVIFRGHTSGVEGARVLEGGRLLSWSSDFTLRIWEAATGTLLHTLAGHDKTIQGVRLLPDGRLLSWSSDSTLRIWDLEQGVSLVTLTGHTKLVKGADRLPDGRLLSWASDGTLRLWTGEGVPLAVLEGHDPKKVVEGARALPDGRILSWCSDSTLRLWTGEGAALAVLEGHDPKKSVKGATVLADGRILSWSNDQTLRLWTGEGVALAVLEGHTDEVAFAVELADGRILSHARDTTFRLWTGAGAALETMAEERAPLDWTAAWMAWKAARRPAWSCGVGVVDELSGGVRLLINDADGPVVVPWHGTRGRWFADSIREDGQVVARDTLSLFFLRLCYGARRVGLEEAQEIIT